MSRTHHVIFLDWIRSSADASFAEPGDGRIPNTLSKKFEKMHDGGLLSVAVNTRGDLLSTTSTDKSIKLWKLSEGAVCS